MDNGLDALRGIGTCFAVLIAWAVIISIINGTSIHWLALPVVLLVCGWGYQGFQQHL